MDTIDTPVETEAIEVPETVVAPIKSVVDSNDCI